MKPRPLDGIRVLDLSRVLAGPWASQLLADYGADVIKVEKPGVGDDTRAWGPPWFGEGEDRTSAYFLCTNRGKRSVSIDIANAEGADKVRTLAREADVLIENYKVGQLAKYGLDAKSLHALNPKLVYCSITGYGQTGPLASKAGYDFAIQAEGGLMSLNGLPQGEPQKVGVAVTDVMTGVYATTAILAALFERQRTGLGRVIDAALLDVQVAMLANQGSNQLISGKTPNRMGNAHPNIVPYQVFPTADGHLVIAVGNDSQFSKLCEVLGTPDWAHDPRFIHNSERVLHRDELIPMITTLTRTQSTAHWITQLESVGVPCSAINDIDQVMHHPQVVARGMRVTQVMSSQDPRDVPLIATPMMFDGQRPLASRPPPYLNQDASISAQPEQAWGIHGQS